MSPFEGRRRAIAALATARGKELLESCPPKLYAQVEYYESNSSGMEDVAIGNDK